MKRSFSVRSLVWIALSVALGCEAKGPASEPAPAPGAASQGAGGTAGASSAGAGDASGAAGSGDAAGAAGSASAAGLVARIGGEPVTESELESAARRRLVSIEAECTDKMYTARLQALEEILQTRLIAQGARAEGVTPEELLAREVEAKAPVPTEDEVRAAFDQTSAQMTAQGRPAPDYAAVRDRFAESVRSQRLVAARTALLQRLAASAPIEVLLEQPLPPKVDVAVEGPAKGPADAPVTLVEFSDYECPFCVQSEPVVRRILEEYGPRIRFVHRDFPLPFHARAQKAAEASWCAEDQGKYWEMHDVLYASQGKLSLEDLTQYAATLGLDSERFRRCIDAGEKASLVARGKAAGEQAGVSGTPAFFVNGRILSGAQSYERLRQVIDAELEAAGKG